MSQNTRQKTGFTLVELLVTIGLVMILMTITITSLNIDKQFKTAREAKRSADSRVILDSITQYLIDQQTNETIPKDNISRYMSKGVYKSKWSSEEEAVPTPNIDLCSILIPKYIAQLPIDPFFDQVGSGGSDDCENYHTGYMVTQNSDGRIIVSAPFAELQPIIMVR